MSILKRCTDFILQSRLQAMGVAFLCAYIPLLGSLGIIIAGLVTLRRGALEGLCVAIAASLPYAIKLYTVSTSQSDMIIVELLLNIASNGLVWLFAVMLRRYNNWGMLLEHSILLGIIIVGFVHLFYPEVQVWWNKQLTIYATKTAAVMSGVSNASPLDPRQANVIKLVTSYATGLFVVSILFNVMLQLVLARWWQAVMFNPGGLRSELRQIRLSHVMGVLFIVAFVLAWLGSSTVMDMMPLLFAAFGAAGLSFMHYYLATVKNTLAWLVILYLLLIWIFPLSVMLLAVIALFDVWMDLRNRLIRPV